MVYLQIRGRQNSPDNYSIDLPSSVMSVQALNSAFMAPRGMLGAPANLGA
ncbi:hypothetical protein NPIL_474811, partial [Nephila pilipes]